MNDSVEKTRSTKPKLILASASPRRADLLRLLGLTFEIDPSHVDENHGMLLSPKEHVLETAKKKVDAVAPRYPNALILGADTVVALGKDILEKPIDPTDARRMLEKLSGKKHQVLTGLTLTNTETGNTLSDVFSTDVTFRCLLPEEIHRYVETGEPLDKAGAYGAQGQASVFIQSITGCFFNVVGLPLSGFWMLYHRLTGHLPAQADRLQDASVFRNP